jgi:hypothetical protein
MSTSIRELYRYAVAEGEGVGTAYEYHAKRRVIAPLLAALPPTPRIVVAGLPEKYGTSLDFILLAAEARAELVILDDGADRIARSRAAVEGVGGLRGMGLSNVEYKEVTLAQMAEGEQADLLLSCEVVQRVPSVERAAFMQRLRACAPSGAVFVPNSANRSHLDRSGLGGFEAEELRSLAGAGSEVDFVDMPPFPPGITRTAAQRESARSGRLEAAAMRMLQTYCDAERFVPNAVRRRLAHIVFARWR